MPSYISHAIMGKDLYKNLLLDNKLLRIFFKEEEVRGYCLGIDFASLSKKVNNDPHNYNTQDFFMNIFKYINDNKLNESEHIMAFLYGHIAHYFLDTNVHPLVYYFDCGCQNKGPFNNHYLIEGYYNSYLTEKLLNKNIMEIKPEFFNQINLNDKEIKKLLKIIYGNVYNDTNIIISYQKVLLLFTILEKFVKSKLVSKKMLVKLSKFEEFLDINHLTREELVNENNLIFTNPVTGIKCRESLLDLYSKSIDMCLDAIKMVNDYLYNSKSLSSLENVFPNISYDTGVDCSLGKKLVHVRK